MLMPDDPNDRIEQTDEALCVRHGVYWTSIWGAPDTANADSVTVYLPMANVFDSDQLTRMTQNIERTGGDIIVLIRDRDALCPYP